MVQRFTEYASEDVSDINEWMARRVRYFGQACLTSQEYRAVVYSLFGLPEVMLKEGIVTVPIELPTQTYVATKMGRTAGRVSQLLNSAGKALIWFEEHGTPEVGWVKAKHGRGAASWNFHAPVLDHPIPPFARERLATVEIIHPVNKVYGIYKLVFAGEL